MSSKNDKDHIGSYIVAHSRLIRQKDLLLADEKEKNDVIDQIAEKCVPKKFAVLLKREFQEDEVQTENEVKAKRKCVEKLSTEKIKVVDPTPSAALGDVMAILARNPEMAEIGNTLTSAGANVIGGCTRLILRKIIQNAKRIANRENRKRIVPSDVDIASGIVEVDYDIACPLLKPTPSTLRMYWGRKMAKRDNMIDANSKEFVSHEKFCDSIMIKDHWLVIEGVTPCVPENVVPTEMKQKYQEQQQETQRTHGFGLPGVRRGTPNEKRVASQIFSQEHQVLFSEVTKTLTSGSALERQRVFDCVENDTGIQFLAGRFVILIAEGVRLHIGTRNIRGLANLLKFTWSLMKNQTVRLEKYLYVLVPTLISCVVNRSMVPIVDPSKASGLKAKATVPAGTSELTNEDRERIIRDLEVEFRLRESAGRLLVELSTQYAAMNLNIRIIQVLRKVLNGNHDPVAIYGVLCTFFAFGNLTVDSVVIPKMHDIYCSLQASRSEMTPVKTTMTKMRKIIVESEAKRIEVVHNRTVELIMKIIYENEILNERKEANRDTYVALYSECGALFYDYALNTGMIDEKTGHLKSTRPSLLLDRQSFILELDKKKKERKPMMTSSYSNPHEPNGDDVSMLDNLLDDSNRPWSKAAAQVDESDVSPFEHDKSTFFRTPKLFLVRKESLPEGGWTASYIRPLEYGYMPCLPSTRSGARKDGGGVTTRETTTARESVVGHSMYASRASEGLKTTKDSGDLLRRFVKRPDEEAGAIIYGRNMLMTEKGRTALDEQISKAASRLSGIRLANAITLDRSVVQNEEMSRGKFLVRPPSLLHTH